MNLGIKLLVAEDDPNMAMILKVYLTQKGYTVFHATDGQQALDIYKEGNVDACILDVMMPVKDGFTVAKELRRIDKNIPILFLTAKSLEADKLKGFEVGADDYITKPFSMDELLARINATIRRSFDENKPENNQFNIGKFKFDYNYQTLTFEGKEPQRLTSKESELLRLFCINFNQLIDRGNTIIIIEHNLDVIKCADHIIDLGPEGGEGGGTVVTTGTPAQVAKHPTSHTAKWLKKVLEK